MFAKIGWAYDLKQPSAELLRKTIEKHGKNKHSIFPSNSHSLLFASLISGDGSHPVYGHGEKAELGQGHHTHAEAIAAPGEPNLGY